jgi:hypothetical protein
LHRARIDAKSFGDLADAFAGVLAFVQGSTDTLFKVEGYPWPPNLLALLNPARTRS